MNLRLARLLMFLVAIFTSLNLGAEEKKEKWMAAGLNEISPSVDFQKEFGTTVFSPRISYGNFPNDFTEGEIETQLLVGSTGGVDFNAFAFLAGASAYYNQEQPLLPFLGLRAGVVTADSSFNGTSITGRSTSLVVAPKVGFVVPINRNIGFKAYFEYQRWSGGSLGGTNHYSVPLGLAFYWK